MPRRAAAAAVLAVTLIAGPSVAATPTLSADAAMTRYRAMLDALPAIGNVVFEYTESRIGPSRALAEVHRVYRDAAGDERNETISVDGEPIVPAISHIASVPQWPYDVHAFAVTADSYQVMALGMAVVNGHRALSFSAVRTTPGDFAVTHLYLDPVRHLPLRESFDTQGGGCSGSGYVDFAPVDRRWMPLVVSVNCALADGSATFKETIKFGAYQFLPAIPSDIFGGATT